MKKLCLFILFALPLFACASQPVPVIELQPQTDIKSSKIGKGKTVVLQVIDARPKDSFSNAKIDPQQNVTQIFNNEITKGLSAYGFSPVAVSNAKAQNQMTVQILAIDYRTLSGMVSTNTETFVSAQVMAKTPTGIYNKTYNASAYSDNYLSHAKQTPDEQVNTAVNKLLNNILNDKALMGFLAN